MKSEIYHENSESENIELNHFHDISKYDIRCTMIRSYMIEFSMNIKNDSWMDMFLERSRWYMNIRNEKSLLLYQTWNTIIISPFHPWNVWYVVSFIRYGEFLAIFLFEIHDWRNIMVCHCNLMCDMWYWADEPRVDHFNNFITISFISNCADEMVSTWYLIYFMRNHHYTSLHHTVGHIYPIVILCSVANPESINLHNMTIA